MKFKQILALVFAIALGYGAGQQGGRLWATDYPTGGGGGLTSVGIADIDAFGAKGDVIGFANGTAAAGTVQVTAGTSDPGTNKVSGITVDSVEIMDGAEDWDTSHDNTATNIKDSINAKISVPDYTATVSTDTVTITSVKFGTTVNGFVVSTSVGGDVETTDVNMASGADGAAALITFRGNLFGNLDAADEFIQRAKHGVTATHSADTPFGVVAQGAETFAVAFSATPHLVATPVGDTDTRALSIDSLSTTGFTPRTTGLPSDASSASIHYIVLGE